MLCPHTSHLIRSSVCTPSPLQSSWNQDCWLHGICSSYEIILKSHNFWREKIHFFFFLVSPVQLRLVSLNLIKFLQQPSFYPDWRSTDTHPFLNAYLPSWFGCHWWKRNLSRRFNPDIRASLGCACFSPFPPPRTLTHILQTWPGGKKEPCFLSHHFAVPWQEPCTRASTEDHP